MKREDFESLIDAYGKSVFAFCGKLCGYTDDANDLYQQTFLRSFELADRIDTDKNPKAFLFSVAVSLYKSRAQKLARRNQLAPREDITDENSEILPSTEDVERDVLSREKKSVLSSAVNHLKDPYRMTVLLFYGGGFSLEEVARILHVPLGTVKSRLHKAKELIRKELEVNGYVNGR